MKLVRCRDHGFDCDFEAKGKTEEEVLNKAAEHVHVVHGVDVTPELADQVRTTIHEIPAQQGVES
jgi:predicted small metal-binding protein